MTASGTAITLCGNVQGVGFRPWVWRLAQQHGLVGRVWNAGGQLCITIWGDSAAQTAFIAQLQQHPPPLARVDRLDCHPLHNPAANDRFEIVASTDPASGLGIAPDAATCPACLAELFDPSNRRFHYPFITCTDCGPRFSLWHNGSFDRANTAMAAFSPCPDCQQEYANPADRRFHSQTQSCAACGPRLWLSNAQGQSIASDNALAACIKHLAQGQLIAIKGLGGFHIACDAGNDSAVQRLRQAKHRDSQAFAIMGTLAQLNNHVAVSPQAADCLQQAAAPIVLLPKHGLPLAAAVAPDSSELGCMLPYTPLHQLLLQGLSRPIVLTSGNPHDAPPCLDNHQALAQLADLVDAFLLHDRAITQRADDSVLRLMADQPRFLRRARGYCPLPLLLPAGFAHAPVVLAMGAELKNTVCLLANGQLQLSAHGGDLKNPDNLQQFRAQVAQLPQHVGLSPQLIAIDSHPDSLASQWGRACAQQQGIPIEAVQHHHAHLAACMADHGLPRNSPPVLGVALDGLGYGDDGSWWGGEFMAVRYDHYQRLATFDALPLIGGQQAIKQPWRSGYAHLSHYFDWAVLSHRYADLPFIQFLNQQPLTLLDSIKQQPRLSPCSSACGRALDALAASLGICLDGIGYEGQAAIMLETLATPVFAEQAGNGYPLAWLPNNALPRISWQPLWQALLHDLQHAIVPSRIAARIHHGLATAIADTAYRLAQALPSDTVVLSGGVFQNRLLLDSVSQRLQHAGLTVLSPRQLPANDGGLAVGQAIVAAARRMGST